MSAVPVSGGNEVSHRTLRFPAALGLLVAAVAAMAILGWVAQVPWMVRFVPGTTAMVFANALSMCLLGIGLALSATRLPWQTAAQAAVGALATSIGMAVLIEYIYGIDLLIDLPVLHGWFNQTGRMAPSTALANVFTGLAMMLMARAHSDHSALAALATAFAAALAGVFGLVTYRLHPELLYGWRTEIGMAVPTGVAFILLGVGIGAVTYRNRRLGGFFREHEALRIGLVAGALMISVGLVAGLTVFSLLQERIDATLRDSLTLAFRNRVDFIDNEIQHVVMSARNIVSRPGIQRELVNWRKKSGDPAALRFLSEALSSFARGGLATARLRDADDRVLVDVGLEREPLLAVRLTVADDASLIWDGSSVVVHMRLPIRRDAALLGSVEITQALPVVTRLLYDMSAIGTTGEMQVCAKTSRGIECFPTRLEPKPYLLTEDTLHGPGLMTEAVAMRQDTRIGIDRHGNRVMAAYGPVDGLGVVLKIDVDEVYAPTRQRFELILLMLAGVVAVSIALLYATLLPLVRRLVRSETQFRNLLEGAPDAMVVSDDRGNIVLVNSQAEKLFGYERAELIGRDIELLQPERFRGKHVEHRRLYARAPHRRPMETAGGLYARRKDGTEFPVEIALSPLDTAHGTVVISTIRDISERLRQVEALRASEQRWQFALEGSGDGVWDWNIATNEVFFSRQWKRMLGYEEHEISTSITEWDRRVHPEDKPGVYADIERHLKGETPVYQNEHRMRCKDGSYKWILDRGMIISRDADGKPARMIGTHTDITDRKRAEETIRALSLVDDLTGLRNRRGFVNIAEAELRLAQRTGRRLSLYFADLDGMKQINDEYGHAEGDRALRDVARILRETFRDSDIIGHLGGDEFVVLAVAADPAEEAGTIARLQERIDRHNREAGRCYQIALSVGVAHHDAGSAETLEELLNRADAEMYRVKQQRRPPR